MIERIFNMSKKFIDLNLLDLIIPFNINMDVKNNSKQVMELVVIKAPAIKI